MPHEIQCRDLGADQAKIEVITRGEGNPVIVGYASVFYREGDKGTEYVIWPGLVERIMPGAFDNAIKEKHDVRGLVNHDPRLLLGRTESGTLKLSVDQRGLRYEIDPPETQVGKDTIVSLKRGDLSGSSFAFRVRKDGYEFIEDESGKFDVVEVRDVELFDVGPVTYPAYSGASSGVREHRSRELVEQWQAWRKERDAAKDEEAKRLERLAAAKERLARIE